MKDTEWQTENETTSQVLCASPELFAIQYEIEKTRKVIQDVLVAVDVAKNSQYSN